MDHFPSDDDLSQRNFLTLDHEVSDSYLMEFEQHQLLVDMRFRLKRTRTCGHDGLVSFSAGPKKEISVYYPKESKPTIQLYLGNVRNAHTCWFYVPKHLATCIYDLDQ